MKKLNVKKLSKDNFFSYIKLGDYMFIAHRGNDDHPYKENSKDGIIYCLQKDYIYGIECDIRLTKDNEIVLFHNMMINSTNNSYEFIHNLTLSELSMYNFPEETITILSDLLDEIISDKIILLEIKEERRNKLESWIEAINKIVNKYHYLNIYLCSFNYELIKNLKNKLNIPIGLIIGYKMNKNKDTSKFDFLMYQYKNIKYSHKLIMAWTVNERKKAMELENRVKYIITDKAYELK